jgi:trk system potassium uptake protein TrkA
VDKKAAHFDQLGPGFNGLQITGTGIDAEVLRAAGAEHADALAAVTADDNTNIMAAQVARHIYKIPRVVARISDPRREFPWQEADITVVSPTVLGAVQIENSLTLPGVFMRRLFVGNGEVEMVEMVADERLAGRRVSELELPGRFRIAAITRAGPTFLPDADTKLESGDRLLAALVVSMVEAIRHKLGI